MEDTIIPYELPERENHSFFFIDQRIDTRLEAKLHQHDAWELYCVVQGRGTRMAGDTLLSFAEGEVALIPPSMHHRWEYDPSSADDKGCVHYLMVAFSHSLIQKCIEVFPELRNRFADISFPTEALIFGPESSRTIRHALSQMKGMDANRDVYARCSVYCRLFSPQRITRLPASRYASIGTCDVCSRSVHTLWLITSTRFRSMILLPKWV